MRTDCGYKGLTQFFLTREGNLFEAQSHTNRMFNLSLKSVQIRCHICWQLVLAAFLFFRSSPVPLNTFLMYAFTLQSSVLFRLSGFAFVSPKGSKHNFRQETADMVAAAPQRATRAKRSSARLSGSERVSVHHSFPALCKYLIS